MKKIWWFLIIVLAVSFLASLLVYFFPLFLISLTYNDYNETYNEIDGSRLYEDYTWDVSMRCPRGWTMIAKHRVFKLGQDQLVFCMQSSGIGVYLGARKYEKTVEDFTKNLVSNANSEQKTIYYQKETLLGGNPAHEITLGDKNSTSMYIYTKKGDNIYSVVYTGLSNAFESNKGEAMVIINSIKFKE